MKKFALTAVALLPLAVSAPAHAQDRAALCQLRQSNGAMAAPASDAAYKPGVDANGKPVAPANIASTGPDQIIRIPMTEDVARQVQMNLPKGTQMQAGIGMIEIHSSGKVMYNGQDITAATDTACASNMPDPAQQADRAASTAAGISTAPVHHKAKPKHTHTAAVTKAAPVTDVTSAPAPETPAAADASAPSITAPVPIAPAPASTPMAAAPATPPPAAATTPAPTPVGSTPPPSPVTDVTGSAMPPSTMPPAATTTPQPQGTVSPVPDAHQERGVPAPHNTTTSVPTGN